MQVYGFCGKKVHGFWFMNHGFYSRINRGYLDGHADVHQRD